MADLIRERIEDGQLGPVLPGEEELGRLFRCFPTTVRGALGLLETEGVLHPATKGFARKVGEGWFSRNKPAVSVRLLVPA